MAFSRDDWDYSKLEELIEARGTDVIHEIGVACPCRSGDSLSSFIQREGELSSPSRIGCHRCQGEGILYRDAQLIRGLITGVETGRDRKLLEAGYALPGDAVFSPSLRVRELHDFDKVTFLHSETVHEGQVVLRNAANMPETAHLRLDVEDNEDLLQYQAHCGIWCEDIDGVVYTEGVDYLFDGKRIRWTGNRPDDGVLYTVKYEAYLEWIAYTSPFDRHDNFDKLGQRVMLRKKHVHFSTGSLADTVAKRTAEESELTTRIKI